MIHPTPYSLAQQSSLIFSFILHMPCKNCDYLLKFPTTCEPQISVHAACYKSKGLKNKCLGLLELHFSSSLIFADFAVVERPATIPRKVKNKLLNTFSQEHIKTRA